ncbi:MAG: hypothetical protein J1G05_03260 [Clostridiales bacterium]|nr:hypothetical protein [Clostridiales bacterium]
MNSKKFVKRRIVTILFAIFSCIAITFGVVKPNFNVYADNEADSTYTYELTSVEVSLNADWIFTNNTPDSMLYKMVSVTVTYKDTGLDSNLPAYVLNLASDGTAATGEKVTFSRDLSARTVTATVTPKVGGENEYNPAQVSGTSSPYTLEDSSKAVVNGITATYTAPGDYDKITTTTQLSDSDIKQYVNVYETYNDGSTNSGGAIGTFNLTGDLFPSVFEADMTADSIYSKEITVEVGEGTDKKTTTVLITGIRFVIPDNILGLSGNFAPQTARSKNLNMNGLTISLMYSNPFAMLQVPASVFPSEFFTPKYTTESGQEVVDEKGQPALNITVKNVQLTFTYPGKAAVIGTFRNIEVYRIAIHTPVFPAERNGTETSLDWNDGASIEITSWDFSTLHTDTGNPPNPQIALYKLSTGSSADSVSDFTVDNGDGKKIVHFPQAGCRYRVDVTLSALNDFMWDSPYNGTKSNDNLIMSFEVQVDKGTPVVTLADIADVTYGTPNGDGTLSATIEEQDMGKDWQCESADNANAHVNEKDAWYYHLEYYTSYTDEANNTPVPQSELRADGKPKKVGTYYVVAVTHENSGYVSVRSEAKPFKITQFEITTAVSDKTFARTDWTIEDFLTSNNSNKLPYKDDPYNETIYKILTITDSQGKVDANKKFTHANEYTVTISVVGDYSTNYKLVGNSSITFSIKTNKDSTFDFDVKGWTYGAPDADPQLSVTKSDPYYPSNTGDIATDYTVKYYKYDSSKPDNKGEEVTGKAFSEFEKGRYLVEFIANKNDDYSDETAGLTEGKNVDYILHVVYHDFEVSAAPIDAPYLDSHWVLSGGTAGEVYRYNDKGNGKEYGFTSWIGDSDNVAADGSAIITVTVSYTQFVTSGDPISITFADGKFTVNKAGNYIVTVTLNKNYSWNDKVSFVPDDNTYTYIGFVARQQLTVLTDGDIEGNTDIYSGIAQEKTIGNWNATALKISNVTVASLGGSHKPVAGGITMPDNTGSTYENKFSVTNAGIYTVSVDIADKDNYEWIDAQSDALRTLSLGYTLEQATLKVKWEDDYSGTTDKESGSYPRFEFNGTLSEQNTPKASANVYSDDNAKLEVTGYTLYTDEFNNNVAGNKITSIGHYYIAVSAFNGDASNGDASANYRLPDPINTDVGTVFEIYAFELDAPTGKDGAAISGKTVSVVYKGEKYEVEEYIGNYDYYSIGGIYRIKIEIFKGDTVSEAKNADTYSVKISLADDNYVWKESVQDYTFTFDIEQLMVVIEWTTVSDIYKPDGIVPPSYIITNKAPDDKVELVLTYKQNDASVELKDAGKYTVYADSLTGEDSENYKIVSGEDYSNNSTPYTVQKRAVRKPDSDLPSGDYNDFDGVSLAQSISFAQDYNNANVTVVISGEIPNSWFNPSPVNTVTIDSISLDFKSGNKADYNFTRAGVYTFTVSLDAKNYFWQGEGDDEDFDTTDKYTYTLSERFTVYPKKLTLPNIKSQRAQEWDKIQPIDFGTAVDGINYSVMYGTKDDDTPNSATWLGYDTDGADSSKGKQGIYYAELTLDLQSSSNAGHLLNYVWEANPDDKNTGSGYLQGYSDVFYYTDGRVAVRIFYAITRGQLDITVFVKEYTFGDNGTLNKASFDKTVAIAVDDSATVYLKGSGAQYATGDNAAKIIDGTLTFTDESGKELSDDDLVNGLPWNAGKYTLNARLHFGDGTTYEDVGVEYTFTVLKRDITVEWGSLKLEYNAQNQLPTATISNVIKKNDDDSTVYTSGLEITIGYNGEGSEHKNVGTYNAKVTALNGAEEALRNFRLPDNLTTDFEITPKDVTVRGVEVSNHIYGDVITADEKKFTDTGFIDGDGAKNAIVVKICKSGETTHIDRYAPVGTYYIIVEWKDSTSIHAKNYNVTFDNEATFEIVKREITVEWNSEGARSEYGESVELYNYIKVTSSNGYGGVDGAYADKQATEIIGLAAYKDNVGVTLGDKTNADTYSIVPSAKDKDNWTITFTNGDNWEYEIYNAKITDPESSLTPESLTYNAQNQKVFANPHVEVKNSELNTVTWKYGAVDSADATEQDVTSWVAMSENNIWLYTAGTYYFVIKLTADNHDDFVKTVTVVIEKATLNVQFNFAIMYGEDDPATQERLFNAVRTQATDGIGWTVTGFEGDDEDKFYGTGDFYNIKGKSEYTVVGYEKGDFTIARTNYAIAYVNGETSLFTVECDNYEFKPAQGLLTVNKITITVTGKSLSVAYNGVVPEIGTEDVGYTVTHPASTYGSEKYVTANANYKDLIEVSSEAFTNHNDNSTTASVGTYTLNVSKKDSDYYDISVNNGEVEITIATLDVNTIGGYSAAYDEQYHGLTVDDESTVNPEDGSSIGAVFATASDETGITVEFYQATRRYSGEITESDLTNLDKLSGTPSYIDCETYRIIYKISAGENYIAVYGYREIVITQSDNELTKDFDFKNETATKSSSLAVAKIAWTYGYKVDEGFNPEGDQTITNPIAKFKRANATDTEVGLKYELRYFATTSASGELISSGDYASATKLFEAMFASGKLNAGHYKLTVYMTLKGTDNFTFDPVDYVFQVAKRNLTITAQDASTVYGEKAPNEFTPVYSGLVINSSASDAKADTIDKAIGNTPEFVTEYVVGNSVGGGSGRDDNQGKYYIRVDNKVASSTNYDIEYIDAWLTVNKREVTIKIDDKESTYNLQNETAVKVLTFKVASGSSYGIYASELVAGKDTTDGYNNENQTLLTLKTEAIVGNNTNNVKFDGDTIVGYTIYAVFNGNCATNYTVYFSGCALKEDDPEAIGYDGSENNAGSYVIKQASFSVVQQGVHHEITLNGEKTEVKSDYYSGATNYYKAHLSDPKETPIEFTYSKKDSKGVYQPIDKSEVIDAGDYRATGSSTNKNYTSAEMTIEFTILKATLTLTANGSTVEYGTTLSGNVETDAEAGGAVATGRFTGFTYTASSEHLLAEIVENYQNNSVAGELITYGYSSYSSSTNAGTQNLKIVPQCAGNANIEIKTVEATLTVIKRKVEVTIVGWDEDSISDATKHNPNAWCYYQGSNTNLQSKLASLLTANYSTFIYTDTAKTFGDSGVSYGALGIKLELSTEASNVGKYEMTYKIDESINKNFNVTFTNDENPEKPQFSVQKAKLTLYAKNANLSGGSSLSYSRVYGDSIELTVARDSFVAPDSFLSYAVEGMVDNESFIEKALGSTYNVAFTVKCGDKAYAPWVSTVGEEYTVAITEFEDVFGNYIVDKYVSATLTIAQRTISASTQDQTFGFDGANYNNGLYGKQHEAVISFADTASNPKSEVDSTAYRPVGYTLKYDTETLKSGSITYQTAGEAPTVVRENGYTVTVTLVSDGNYVFEGGSYSTDLKFNVEKYTVSVQDLQWLEPTISTDNLKGDTLSNYIANYQAGYMTVVQFEFVPMGGNATDISEGGKDTLGTYYFDEDGVLHITMEKDKSVGKYTVRIELKSTATNNINLVSDTDTVNFVSASFDVTTKTVTIAVEFDDFIYGGNPGTPRVYINKSETPTTVNISVSYALITDSDAQKIADLYKNSSDNKGLTATEVVDLERGSLSISPNFVAGYYLLFAQYSGETTQSRYYVFKVEKKTIDIPKVTVTGFTYNGSEQSLDIKYSATDMRPVYSGVGINMTITAEGVTFTAVTAGEYSIGFVLVDSANTLWSKTTDATVSGDTLTFTWKIDKDSSENNLSYPVIEVPELSEITYGEVYDQSKIKLKDGYNGIITLYYKEKDSGVQRSADGGWEEYDPNTTRLAAKSYWIKVVLTDPTGNNYSEKEVIVSLTIARKEITATVSGEITYGDDLSQTLFRPVVEGIISGDPEAQLDNYTYKFAEEYRIVAGGEYYIILDTDDNGEVVGISAENYMIKAVRGLLVVNKRNVTVNITGKSSDYSVTPDVSADKMEYTVNNLAPNEDKTVLDIVFETNATSTSAAGGEYWITIYSYDMTNYVVSYQRAIYVINPLEVEVQLVAQTNVFYGDEDIWCANFDENTIKISNSLANAEFVKKDLKLTLWYTGSSYAGVAIDRAEKPSDAGVYLAKVTGASSNYRLVGMPEVEFTIQKRILDDSLLNIENQTYTGELLTPVVTVNGSKFEVALFDATSNLPDSVNAGTYDVVVYLNDSNNYQWASTPGTSVIVKFTVGKADDEETSRLTIKGWQYGTYSAAENSPSAQVKSGGTIYYEYSTDGGETYSSIVPDTGSVGTYYVRVVVAESNNYNAYTGAAVSFDITKFLFTVPVLTSEDITYTGSELIANISDFDSRYMSVTDDSDARTFLGASSITAVAINAGVYNIYIALSDIYNYGWLENAGNAQGVLTLTWTVAKKKVALPTAGKNRFVVNGEDIVYIPDGFDESIMAIENNVYSYGGDFTAVVTLKDTSNYEWENGEEAIKIKWHITGAETVFAIILSALIVLATAGAAGIATQLLLNRRRKRAEASAMNDIESKDIDGNTTDEGGNE